MQITITEPDRRRGQEIEHVLEVQPRFDDIGRYVEAAEVILEKSLMWRNKLAMEYVPETWRDAKRFGDSVYDDYRDEIDEQVRKRIRDATAERISSRLRAAWGLQHGN